MSTFAADTAAGFPDEAVAAGVARKSIGATAITATTPRTDFLIVCTLYSVLVERTDFRTRQYVICVQRQH
ncbi:hypothetical protein GCM10020221_29370 [Streptomyces thioluteus]|uniref:Uncharacterized protein n=2 Tax=Streptomyces TaxID=1883 RepID=A0A2N8NXC8_STREU|nr:hypothetical protein [Streptomyces eurocidicus]MBB5120471.1 hypothetical protein [Streptomyces eurocidicus]MBF6053683.1 hypothetical protein [Streptomyces eurocidicus]PNE33433.1 hypothetical protein AF335_11115 [Streptomyces eurocidicus]